MEKEIKYIFWQDENFWLGYIEEFPDYCTQGTTLDELKVNLQDIYKELTSGNLPHPRQVGILKIA